MNNTFFARYEIKNGGNGFSSEENKSTVPAKCLGTVPAKQTKTTLNIDYAAAKAALNEWKNK